jgi:hypothetical protein
MLYLPVNACKFACIFYMVRVKGISIVFLNWSYLWMDGWMDGWMDYFYTQINSMFVFTQLFLAYVWSSISKKKARFRCTNLPIMIFCYVFKIFCLILSHILIPVAKKQNLHRKMKL